MGVYAFRTKFLIDQLRRDAATPDSSRDFGKDIIPWLVKNSKAVAHRFDDSCVRSSREKTAYWRDVGRSTPIGRPISTSPTSCRNSTFMTEPGRSGPMPRSLRQPSSCTTLDGRRGMAVSSLVSGDCIVSGRFGAAQPAVHRRARAQLFHRWKRPLSCHAAISAAAQDCAGL